MRRSCTGSTGWPCRLGRGGMRPAAMALDGGERGTKLFAVG
jgi:hypothetical protein